MIPSMYKIVYLDINAVCDVYRFEFCQKYGVSTGSWVVTHHLYRSFVYENQDIVMDIVFYFNLGHM